jgi:hypothetical protein
LRFRLDSTSGRRFQPTRLRFVDDHMEPHEPRCAISDDAAALVARGTFAVNGGLVLPARVTDVSEAGLQLARR